MVRPLPGNRRRGCRKRVSLPYAITFCNESRANGLVVKLPHHRPGLYGSMVEKIITTRF